MALAHVPYQDQQLLGSALVAQPDLLLSMSSWRHGSHTASLALEIVRPQQRRAALLKLQQCTQRLQKTRYGKKLSACVENLLQEEQCDHGTPFSSPSLAAKIGKQTNDKAHCK